MSFRHYTRQEANKLGVRGFVRNRPDGSVEAVAVGDEAALDGFRAFLQQGPSMARVERVEEEAHETDELPVLFEIRH